MGTKTYCEMETYYSFKEVNMWKTIETAPKDGTEILVYYDFATVPIAHVAFYRDWEADESLRYCGWTKEDTGWWCYPENSIGQIKLEAYNTPTHWMPFERPMETQRS